jgi:hypothetical protein
MPDPVIPNPPDETNPGNVPPMQPDPVKPKRGHEPIPDPERPGDNPVVSPGQTPFPDSTETPPANNPSRR